VVYSIAETTRGLTMRKLSAAFVGAGLLALAACGGSGDDTAGDNAASAAEAQAENLEAMADNTTNEAAADSLENQADAVENAGEAKEEAIDDADVNATNAQ
jgi:ABC-type glycerol-3-phosphate transport system substrate-binding protein